MLALLYKRKKKVGGEMKRESIISKVHESLTSEEAITNLVVETVERYGKDGALEHFARNIYINSIIFKVVFKQDANEMERIFFIMNDVIDEMDKKKMEARKK